MPLEGTHRAALIPARQAIAGELGRALIFRGRRGRWGGRRILFYGPWTGRAGDIAGARTLRGTVAAAPARRLSCVRVLIFHGYLLQGTGSNVYNAELGAALVRGGHELHLLCQDGDPFALEWVDAVGTWAHGVRWGQGRPPPAGP